MKTEIEIIKLFIREKKPKTIREISRALEKDYKIIHTAVQLLVNKSIIITETIGSSTLCRLSNNYGIEVYTAESERREKILQNKNIEQINKEINTKIKTSFYILLLFGSYAKNKQTKNSDIDVVILVCDSMETKKVYAELAHECELNIPPIHLYVFKNSEFFEMLVNKEVNYGKEIVKNNLILYGGQIYFQIIEEAIKNGFTSKFVY